MQSSSPVVVISKLVQPPTSYTQKLHIFTFKYDTMQAKCVLYYLYIALAKVFGVYYNLVDLYFGGSFMKLEWKTCFKIGVSIFLLYLCINYWPAVGGFIGSVFSAAAPLFVGFAVAYLVNILMSRYELYYFPKSTKNIAVKSRRPVCMIAAYLTLIAIIALVIGLVIPEFTSCIKLLIDMIPGAMDKVIEIIDKYDLLSDDNIAFLESIDWKSRISEIFGVLTSGIGNVVDVVINTVSSVFSAIVTGFLSLIFSVYLLMGRDKLMSQCSRVAKRYIKSSWYDKITYVLSILNDCFRKYIVGQCTEAVILGALCTVGMLILQLPYATMIGALVALTALIPVAGAYIGAAVGAFMILTVSPIKALIFLIFLVILQQFEGNVIYPKVVGSSLGLPGIWVLAAITVGGGIMGIMGMLIGVPVAATVYRIVKNDINKSPDGVKPALAEAPAESCEIAEQTEKVVSKPASKPSGKPSNKSGKSNKSKKKK